MMRKATSRKTTRKAHGKKHAPKKSLFKKLLTAEGWKRLMTGKK